MNYSDLPIILLFLENTYIIKQPFGGHLLHNHDIHVFPYLTPQTFMLSYLTPYSSDKQG